MTPNPSIHRTGKKLRFLPSGDFQRWASSMYLAPLLILLLLISGCAGAPEVTPPPEKGTALSVAAIDGPSEYANLSALIPAIRRKVKGNIVLLQNIPLSSNPAVVVSFSLFPSGNVADLKVTKSSGSDQLDSAVLRAIKRAEPLPVLSSWKNSDTAKEIKIMYQPYEQ